MVGVPQGMLSCFYPVRGGIRSPPIVLVARAPFLEFGSCILVVRGFRDMGTGATGELRRASFLWLRALHFC